MITTNARLDHEIDHQIDLRTPHLPRLRAFSGHLRNAQSGTVSGPHARSTRTCSHAGGVKYVAIARRGKGVYVQQR
jgi:hypothetical protein